MRAFDHEKPILAVLVLSDLDRFVNVCMHVAHDDGSTGGDAYFADSAMSAIAECGQFGGLP